MAVTFCGRNTGEQRECRQILGVGMAGGFFAGLAGYAVTGNGWWFASPFIGIVIAWHVACGRWPFI